jgi:PKD repeat protein
MRAPRSTPRGPWARLAPIVFIVLTSFLLLAAPVSAASAEDQAPPVADAGPDLAVDAPAAARLDGTASTDDIGVVDWTWTLEDGGEAVTLHGAVAYCPFATAGNHTVTLNVTDAAGNWATDSLVVTVRAPPGPPRDPLALDRDGYVELRWSPPLEDGGAPVQAYVVYRGLAAEELNLFGLAGEDCLAYDIYVRNGWTYHYAVRAMSEVGMGPLCTAVNATPISVPRPPVNLTVEVVGTDVLVSWEPALTDLGAAGATGYNVYRGTDPDMLSHIKEVRWTHEYKDISAEPGVTYYYAVSAKAEIGQSNLTPLATVTVPSEAGGDEPDAADTWLPVAGLAMIVVAATVVVARRARRARG